MRRLRARGELDSITRAVATVKDTYDKQREDLNVRLGEFLAQHRLSRNSPIAKSRCYNASVRTLGQLDRAG
jgi:hypothetical protein